MLASFLIYFHSTRLNNLTQMLRWLHEREEGLLSVTEVLLLCQDVVGSVYSPVETRLFNLDQKHYHRSAGINRGAQEAKGDVLIILDSDRLMLTHGYFLRQVTSLPPMTLACPQTTLDLLSPATDLQLRNLDVSFNVSTRYSNPEVRGKNAFSGNTVIRRNDYLAMGGMDEEMWGYGFQDNDAAMTAQRHGITTLFTLDLELHLWHPRDETAIADGHRRNANYFAKKWQING